MDLRDYVGGRNGRAEGELPPVAADWLSGPAMQPEQQPDVIELRSPDVDEVLSKPPAWLVRWGITVLAFVLLVLGGVAYWVEYPDLVKATLKVVATQWPKSVIARTEGRLMRLLVQEQQPVKAGQQLAFLESTANTGDVLMLDKVVDSLIRLEQRGQIQEMIRNPLPSFFQLGELQQSYQTFQETSVRANALTTSGAYSQKREVLQNDLQQLTALSVNNEAQIQLYEHDLTLTEAELKSQERLMKQGYVSQNDYRQMLSRYLSKKQTVAQARNAVHSHQMSQNQKKQELVELDRTVREQRNTMLQSLHTLKSQLEAWKQRFVVMAPTNGRVSFLTPLQEGQSVKAGQELLYVLPAGAGYTGEMYVGEYNFGKVRQGQPVIVKFKSYPYQEFGVVTGSVLAIGDIPRDSLWRVAVQFPQGLKTSTGRQLPFRNGMMASAEIITEQVSLLERFFYDLRKLIR